MGIGKLTESSAVVAAIKEFDKLGRDAFLKNYGYGKATTYYLRYQGKHYDPEAIAGVAYGYQYTDEGPLSNKQLSGGETAANAALSKLEFEIVKILPPLLAPPHPFGELPAVPPGTPFVNRQALHDAGVHRQNQAGITGLPAYGAESIVLSGGYEDDEDYGDLIIYTGQGGQLEGKQVADQELKSGNAALVTSMAHGLPVRVIRAASHKSPYSPKSGLVYSGLFTVEDFWSESGKSGFLIWRYRLRAIPTAPQQAQEQVSLASPQGNATPGRAVTTTQRIVRSTAVADYVKRTHDYTCQVCGVRLVTPTGAYAEAAHIRALGRPHNGPDEVANVLCLCPNHHVLFDMGMIAVGDELTVLDLASNEPISDLRCMPGHDVSLEHALYHREHHERTHSTGS